VRPGDEGGDFANRSRQCRRSGESFDEMPKWAAEPRKMQPWVPRTDQRTLVVDGPKVIESALDANSHVIIECVLLRAEIGRGE
jgi:hypothetical protein